MGIVADAVGSPEDVVGDVGVERRQQNNKGGGVQSAKVGEPIRATYTF